MTNIYIGMTNNLIGIILNYALIALQIPIVVVKPGRDPLGRTGPEHFESGHDTTFPNDQIWNLLDKTLAPCIIAWNGSSHYVPTIHLSSPELAQWNLDCLQVFNMASLDILQKMDRQHIGEQGKVLLSELECRMIECVAHFKDGAQVQNKIEVNMSYSKIQ